MASPTIQPRILITAGPTHEPIDQVRYLGNRSSGRMGLALAQAAAKRNWTTTLLLGPTSLEPPNDSHVKVLRFQTAAELQVLLHELWPSHDVLLMAAAVADYTFHDGAAHVEHPHKIARTGEPLTLTFQPTPDLLANLATITRKTQFVVGFALEPVERLEAAAMQKLKRKRLDAIVANPLETMDSATISATVMLADGQLMMPQKSMAKSQFASWLFEQFEPLILSRMAQTAV